MTRSSRRDFLKRAGATVTVAAGLAGCSGTDDTQQPPQDEEEEASPSESETQTENSTTAPSPPNLHIEASVPDIVSVGETLEVDVELSNDGGQSATQQLVLRANDQVLATKEVTVSSNGSRTATLASPVARAPPDGQLELRLSESSIGAVRVPSPSKVDGVSVSERPPTRRAGATHVSPKYRLDQSRDILNEGAHVLEKLGTRVFKGWLDQPDIDYPFAEWPNFDSLVEVVEHPHFAELFERGFDTYVFNTMALTDAKRQGGGGYFYHEFTDQQAAAETEAFYELTKYLLETYNGTGMEIVFQNWEGDWIAVAGAGNEGPPDADVLDRMKQWFNARQRGIDRARREVESDVAILGACEINRVREPIETDENWIVNTILSDLDVDLVSYSAWDLCRYIKSNPRVTDEMRDEIHNTLDYIAENAPPESTYAVQALGADTPQVYLGEYGSPLNGSGIDSSMRAIRAVDTEARAWGVPYTLFWETYDNEVVIDGEEVIVDPNIESILEQEFPSGVTRDNLRGYYLHRPDGTRAPPWYYLAEEFTSNQTEFYRLDLEFEYTVSESQLNSDIESGEGRELAFACYEIGIETTRGSTTLDVGTPGEEGALARGVFPPEETTNETFRWFGRPRAQTRLYFHRDELGLQGSIKRLRLNGSGADNNLGVRVFLDERPVGTFTLDKSRRESQVQVESS